MDPSGCLASVFFVVDPIDDYPVKMDEQPLIDLVCDHLTWNLLTGGGCYAD